MTKKLKKFIKVTEALKLATREDINISRTTMLTWFHRHNLGKIVGGLYWINRKKLINLLNGKQWENLNAASQKNQKVEKQPVE